MLLIRILFFTVIFCSSVNYTIGQRYADFKIDLYDFLIHQTLGISFERSLSRNVSMEGKLGYDFYTNYTVIDPSYNVENYKYQDIHAKIAIRKYLDNQPLHYGFGVLLEWIYETHVENGYLEYYKTMIGKEYTYQRPRHINVGVQLFYKANIKGRYLFEVNFEPTYDIWNRIKYDNWLIGLGLELKLGYILTPLGALQ